MERNDRIYLIIINLLAQIMFVFYGIFFNIFVFSISSDLNFVMAVNAVGIAMNILVQFFLTKIINCKTASTLYKLSFIFIFLAIVLAFFVRAESLWLVWIIVVVFSVGTIFFYVPHEIAVIGKTRDYSIAKYLGFSSVISSIAAISSPLISGFIIGTWSYMAIFSVIAVLALAAFVLSLFINDFYTDSHNLGLRKFFKLSHSDKKISYAYISYGMHKLSQDSVLNIVLPIFLFMKVGSEFSVGIYSSVFSLAASGCLLLYIYLVRFKKYAMWAATVVNLVMSVLLICSPSFVMFIIYYAIRPCCSKIYLNGVNESTFGAINGTVLGESKREHHFVFSLYNHVGCLIAYAAAFLIYNLAATELALFILILVLSFFQIVSVVFLNKSDRLTHCETVAAKAEN